MAAAHNPTSRSQESGYTIRPNFQQKFKAAVVKPVIHDVLVSNLSDKDYDVKQSADLCKLLSAEITAKLKDLQLDRYKFLVQVIIGEQKGEGVNVASRCLWDSDTDSYTHDIFMNNTMFCVATVYGVFYY